MRVLHVHSGNLYGGVETFLATLARCRPLAPSMEMTVALCFDGAIAAELRDLGVSTPMLGAVRLRRPDSVWRARQALRELLTRDRFDVVVCHQPWPLAIFGSIVKDAGVPLVSWIHMAQVKRHWLDTLSGLVEADCVICNSRYTASVQPVTRARIETIYYPVLAAGGRDTDGTPAREELQTAPDAAVVIQVSRMEKLKGQTICLQALGELRDEPNWTCWQVGGAQRPSEVRYAEELRAQAQRLGIADRVRFLGHRSDVSRLLNDADIFCQPNIEPEAFGISLIEALASGIPVASSDIGGAQEIVDASCGALVPAGDAALLAATLRQWIDDRALRTRLGHAGRQRARELCEPAAQMRRITEVLESVACRHVH